MNNHVNSRIVDRKIFCFICVCHICQVTRIWRVTPASLYFQPHLRLSPVFTRILLKSPAPAPAFCLMETVLSRRTFSQEGKQKNGCRSTQICHQINYLRFESIFQHIAIVQSFDAISSHKNVKKILADILWSFF